MRRSRSRDATEGPRRQRQRHHSARRHRHHDHHRHDDHRPAKRERSPEKSAPEVEEKLPFDAPHLKSSSHSSHFKAYFPAFRSYLDLQKRKNVEEMDSDEVRGRWKSFVKKWNAGALAEGWYDPWFLDRMQQQGWQMDSHEQSSGVKSNATRRTDRCHHEEQSTSARSARRHTHLQQPRDEAPSEDEDASESDGDSIGPALPSAGMATNDGRPADISASREGGQGPSRPVLSDLTLQREMDDEAREEGREAIRGQRRLDRKEQKARLEEVAPRAEAGSRERMLEKKRERADANRSFAHTKTEASGAMVEMRDSDLLGAGDDDSVDAYKRRQKEAERKRSEREIRREEVARARAEERALRVQQYREREEHTLKDLIALARARYG